MTDSLEHCIYYQAESQNVKGKNYCSGVQATKNGAVPNNEKACLTAGGTWETQKPFGIPAPDCKLADFSRDNHLGNTLGGETANYTWIIPSAAQEPCITTGSCNCALRIRYNITTNESSGVTDDFIDSRNNSIIHNNQPVQVENNTLALALNTAQYGRTFQDRSYMFHIIPRPAGVSSSDKIYNLNVRGKRGNIVQTFPATEYDFTPNRLTIDEGDFIHFQWTGCDTNPNGNAGEGLAGTDRSNIVQIHNLNSNMPVGARNESVAQYMFDSKYLRTRMSYIDQKSTDCNPAADPNNNNDPQNCAKLNGAKSPYFDAGLVRMNNTGTFFYQSTRNNNFSNRTQKGMLVITPKKKAASNAVIVGVVLGGIGLVAAGLIGLFIYGKKNPHSAVGRVVDRIPRVPIERYMPSRSGSSISSSRREPLLN